MVAINERWTKYAYGNERRREGIESVAEEI